MDKRLIEYAELIVKMGIRPAKGQEVIIMAGLEQVEFTRLVVELCYKEGASKVQVDWQDMPTAKLAQLYQSEEKLSSIEDWELAKLKWRSETLPAFLWLDSDDPDGMDGINQGKRARAQMARFPKIKPFRDAMENKYQWCIAGVPGVKWANKVFPDLSDEEAVDKLWDAILTAARAKDGAIENWKKHNQRIHELTGKLNQYNFSALEYKSSNGTDFRASLIPESHWCGGGETTLSGNFFNPNLPTEEVFISPKKGFAEGKVVSTKPLSYQGQIIDEFYIVFKDGMAVEWDAKQGKELLDKMLSMDEGARYLGELALIPHNSPIANTGILFYNTLFDENASCHLALGRGFCDTIDGFEDKSLEECHELGINDSMIHVDFMIGAPDLQITGYKDGVAYKIFENGNWAF